MPTRARIHSVTYSTDTASEWNGSATDTGDTVYFRGDPVNDAYSVNTYEEGAVGESLNGMSMNEDGDYEYSAQWIEEWNGGHAQSGSQADDPTDWSNSSGSGGDYTLWISGDNDGVSSSGRAAARNITPGFIWMSSTTGSILRRRQRPAAGDDRSARGARATPNADTADHQGPPTEFGFEQGGLPRVSLVYEPDTSGMKGDALPEAEISQLTNVQGTGTYDGISRAAPPTPKTMLIALAAAGRDPADIVIPTNGSRAASGSGGGEGTSGSGSSSSSSSTSSSTGGTGFGSDAVRTGGSGGASPSGVMVSQGVVSVGGPDQPSGTGSTSGTRGSGVAGATPDVEPPSDGGTGGGEQKGGHEGGYAWWDPRRWIPTPTRS